MPLSLGVILAGALSIPAGVVDAYVRAYLTDPPCFKFGREGTFDFGIIFALVDGFLVMVVSSLFALLLLAIRRRLNVLPYVTLFVTAYWIGILVLKLPHNLIDFGLGIYSLPLAIMLDGAFAVVVYLGVAELFGKQESRSL